MELCSTVMQAGKAIATPLRVVVVAVQQLREQTPHSEQVAQAAKV